MLSVFYGLDQVSAREALVEYANSRNLDLRFLEAGEWPETGDVIPLFGKQVMWLGRELVKQADSRELEIWVKTSTCLITLENEVSDKVLKNLPTNVEVREFKLPSGGLPEWFVTRIQMHGGRIDLNAAKQVIFRLGINERKNLKSQTLWMLEQEADKLVVFANGETITLEVVKVLVSNSEEGLAFAVVDAAVAGNIKQALAESEKIYRSEKDESAATLLLAGSLADTLRGIRLLQSAKLDNMSTSGIAQQSAWPEWKGRKLLGLAGKLSSKKVTDALAKLSALDMEIKQGGVPSRVAFELILGSLTGDIV